MKLALSVRGIPARCHEDVSTFAGRHHDVAASVGRIRLPADKTASLEIIDQSDDLAGVQAQKRCQVALRRTSVIDGECEDGIRPNPQTVPSQHRVGGGERQRIGSGEEEAEVVRQLRASKALGRRRAVGRFFRFRSTDHPPMLAHDRKS